MIWYWFKFILWLVVALYTVVTFVVLRRLESVVLLAFAWALFYMLGLHHRSR